MTYTHENIMTHARPDYRYQVGHTFRCVNKDHETEEWSVLRRGYNGRTIVYYCDCVSHQREGADLTEVAVDFWMEKDLNIGEGNEESKG